MKKEKTNNKIHKVINHGIEGITNDIVIHQNKLYRVFVSSNSIEAFDFNDNQVLDEQLLIQLLIHIQNRNEKGLTK